MAGLYFVYYGSANYETKGYRGISHLMEHLMCHRIDKIENNLLRDGIEWNAFTANDVIMFHWTGLTDKIEKYKYKIIDLMLADFNTKEEIFQNEKKIVLQEYNDGFNVIENAHSENLDRKIYNIYNPIGSKKDLQALTLKDCKLYFDRQFREPHRIIYISKNNEKAAYQHKPHIPNILKTQINAIPFNKYEHEKLTKSYSNSSVIYQSKMIHADFAAIIFICMMLGSGMTSPLYSVLREKHGLVYGTNCWLERKNMASGYISISLTTDKKSANKCIEILKEIVDNPDKYMTRKRYNIIMDMTKVQMRYAELFRYSHVWKYVLPIEWRVHANLEKMTYKNVREIYNKHFKNFQASIDSVEFK